MLWRPTPLAYEEGGAHPLAGGGAAPRSRRLHCARRRGRDDRSGWTRYQWHVADQLARVLAGRMPGCRWRSRARNARRADEDHRDQMKDTREELACRRPEEHADPWRRYNRSEKRSSRRARGGKRGAVAVHRAWHEDFYGGPSEGIRAPLRELLRRQHAVTLNSLTSG